MATKKAYSVPDGQKYDTEAMKDDEIEIPVQINGKTKAVIKISVETTKEEAIVAGKEAIADKLTGNIVKICDKSKPFKVYARQSNELCS